MSSSSPQAYQQAQYSLAVRPITDGERKVALDSLKYFKYNAIAFSIVGLMTAVATSFASDVILLLVPLLFVLMAGDPAVKYKRNSDAIGKALAAGTVPEIAGIPEKKSRSSWTIGPMTFSDMRGLAKMLPGGAISKMAFLPGVKMVLSVNGVPLKKGAPIIAMPADFAKDLTIPAMPIAPVPPPRAVTNAPPVTDELPPPPDDWEEVFCSRCGQKNPKGAKFCSRCGNVIQR